MEEKKIGGGLEKLDFGDMDEVSGGVGSISGVGLERKASDILNRVVLPAIKGSVSTFGGRKAAREVDAFMTGWVSSNSGEFKNLLELFNRLFDATSEWADQTSAFGDAVKDKIYGGIAIAKSFLNGIDAVV